MATLKFTRAHDGGLEEFSHWPCWWAVWARSTYEENRQICNLKEGQAILRFSLSLIDVPPFCIRESSANDHDEVDKDPNA